MPSFTFNNAHEMYPTHFGVVNRLLPRKAWLVLSAQSVCTVLLGSKREGQTYKRIVVLESIMHTPKKCIHPRSSTLATHRLNNLE